jgi:hypothetical protein
MILSDFSSIVLIITPALLRITFSLHAQCHLLSVNVPGCTWYLSWKRKQILGFIEEYRQCTFTAVFEQPERSLWGGYAFGRKMKPYSGAGR